MTDNIEGKLIPTGGPWLPGPATRPGEEELRYTNGSDTAEAYWHRTDVRVQNLRMILDELAMPPIQMNQPYDWVADETLPAEEIMRRFEALNPELTAKPTSTEGNDGHL